MLLDYDAPRHPTRLFCQETIEIYGSVAKTTASEEIEAARNIIKYIEYQSRMSDADV